MKQHTITITIKTDASDEALTEIVDQMIYQLESLNDGTLELEEGNPVDFDYVVCGSSIKS